MRFWDASALVPLILAEPRSKEFSDLLREDRKQMVWWGALLECQSAIHRHERNGSLASHEVSRSLDLLDRLAANWTEVLPGNRVKFDATRFLATHPLKAAGALQLAAATSWRSDPGIRPDFVCLDERLADAARREGFRSLPTP